MKGIPYSLLRFRVVFGDGIRGIGTTKEAQGQAAGDVMDAIGRLRGATGGGTVGALRWAA